LEPSGAARRLSPADKLGLAAEIVGVYVRVRWLLWRRDLPTVVATIEAGTPEDPGVPEPAALQAGTRLASATSRCLALLPADSRCLVRSLVLMALLVRRGIASALVIGVRPGGADFGAHAWVERNTKPLLPSGGGNYARFLELGRQIDTPPA
jgi:hypothetical protein